MDGVHPSRCVEWRWCVLLLSCPVQWCGSCPTHPIAVLISTAVMSCTVACRLWCCGVGECVSVVFVWWGILCSPPPRRGGGWGHRGWWGVIVVVGGIADSGAALRGRAGGVTDSPSNVGVPLVVYPVALLNGGSGGLCVAPCSDWVWHLALYCSPSHCPFPSYRSRSSSVLCCCVCCGWGSVVGELCLAFFFSFHRLCSLSQHCWFRVVSL